MSFFREVRPYFWKHSCGEYVWHYEFGEPKHCKCMSKKLKPGIEKWPYDYEERKTVCGECGKKDFLAKFDYDRDDHRHKGDPNKKGYYTVVCESCATEDEYKPYKCIAGIFTCAKCEEDCDSSRGCWEGPRKNKTPNPSHCLYCSKCAGKEEPEYVNLKKMGLASPSEIRESLEEELAEMTSWKYEYLCEHEKGGGIMSVVDKVKQLAKSKDQKLLEKYHVVECDQLTPSGEQLLLNVLFEANKELVLEKLREVEKEENKKK